VEEVYNVISLVYQGSKEMTTWNRKS